ncbi:hypothetical protein GLAREA_02740 [Glarea lozoyensis ATCC 20868]|uniref:Uncharacterized protein n=1 Tax=Glarea lozoyensis (strain ATCC 20868 / MF5171) TaxID=1116229 RepID=S3D457_GLAL2|nr:uncharacterized protein GLAREA_02740 [Glarea lozoyensis ATCC 20868]EPE26826.1 hypothetical protein GLAREA_02740 [Glarea lozoyensis ATCC 20868]
MSPISSLSLSDSASQLPPHYSPTRSSTGAPPPYRQTPSTSFNSNSFEALETRTSASNLVPQTVDPASETTLPSSTTESTASSPSPASNLPNPLASNSSTLRILTHQPSDTVPIPPPIYKRNPSPVPSTTRSSYQTFGAKQARTSTSPPSYTPQAPIVVDSTGSNSSSGLYERQDCETECWCFPSFWSTIPRERRQTQGREPHYVIAREGAGT